MDKENYQSDLSIHEALFKEYKARIKDGESPESAKLHTLESLMYEWINFNRTLSTES